MKQVLRTLKSVIDAAIPTYIWYRIYYFSAGADSLRYYKVKVECLGNFKMYSNKSNFWWTLQITYILNILKCLLTVASGLHWKRKKCFIYTTSTLPLGSQAWLSLAITDKNVEKLFMRNLSINGSGQGGAWLSNRVCVVFHIIVRFQCFQKQLLFLAWHIASSLQKTWSCT